MVHEGSTTHGRLKARHSFKNQFPKLLVRIFVANLLILIRYSTQIILKIEDYGQLIYIIIYVMYIILVCLIKIAL